MKWISVKHRLPELGLEVLCYERNEVYLGHLFDDNGYNRLKARKPEKYPPLLLWYRLGSFGEPSHWMPLPSALTPETCLTMCDECKKK